MLVINVVKRGGIHQFYLALSKYLDVRNIMHIEYETFLQTFRKIVKLKEKQILFTCNTKEVYFFVLLSYLIDIEINLILHDHKERNGASIREKLLLRLFKIFESKFNKVIVHSSLCNKGIYLKMPYHGENITERKLNILQFGRIEEYKNIEFLVDLVSQDENVSLVIAGSGAVSDSVMAKINKYKNVSLINQFIDENLLSRLVLSSDAISLMYSDITQTGLVDFAINHRKILLLSDIEEFKIIPNNNLIRHFDINNISNSYSELQSLLHDIELGEINLIEFDNLRTDSVYEWNKYADVIADI